MSKFWITADGQLYGMDNRERGYQGRSRPRSVSTAIPEGVFEELMELALAAREASRRWYERNPNYARDPLTLRERAQSADGDRTSDFDGVDVSVNVSRDGISNANECNGGQWAELERRFFALVDAALVPSLGQ